MPHPERACEAVARQRRRTRPVRVGRQRRWRVRTATYSGARDLPPDMSPIDSAVLERHGLKPDEYDRIVRA